MAEILDIFNDDAFSMVTLTSAVNKAPYVPSFLGSLGIFTPAPIRTIDAAIAMTDEGDLSIVPTTPRGAPPIEQITKPQNVRSFRTPRVAIGDTIYASELQGILARASWAGGADMQIMMQDLASEIAYRVDGPGKLRAKQEATKEHMRLGAISGIVLDADGSTVLYNWATLWGVSLPVEIDFDLDNVDPDPGVLEALIRATKRSILRAAKAGNLNTANVVALCGDAFFDALVRHPDVRERYLVFTASQPQRQVIDAFSRFSYGGIDWINYRGTDDTTTIGIATDKCKFVPTGVPGLFQEILGPGESFQYVNTPGLPLYLMTIPDTERNQFVRIETYSYPMYVATRPDVLFSGRMT
jgi:hypothetical protein